jgi:hypothetical protein
MLSLTTVSRAARGIFWNLSRHFRNAQDKFAYTAGEDPACSLIKYDPSVRLYITSCSGQAGASGAAILNQDLEVCVCVLLLCANGRRRERCFSRGRCLRSGQVGHAVRCFVTLCVWLCVSVLALSRWWESSSPLSTRRRSHR